MDTRTKIGILLIVYAVQTTVSAPAWDSAIDHGYRIRRSGEVASGRIFWSSLGDILETLPFLPFTVNVPDTLSSMWSFFTSFLPGSSGSKKPADNSTALRISGEDIMDYFLF